MSAREEIRVSVSLPLPMHRLIEFFGELGPRWGLSGESCRVHGYLYLRAQPATEGELRAALGIDGAVLEGAIAWLKDYRLIERSPGGAWRTESDPWELMVRALEERRRREVGPALDVLRECRRISVAERRSNPVLYAQIGKLLALAEDFAAIDTQARRLSPRTLRQMIGIGSRALRVLDLTFGGRDK